MKLSEKYQSLQLPGADSLFAACAEEEDDDGGGDLEVSGSAYPLFSSWKAGFLKAFKEVDDQLSRGTNIDCICSGTTAVSVVKQVRRPPRSYSF